MSEGYNILKSVLVSAPEAPGIYQMFGVTGEILYVGKAKNLKNRLKNYISNNLTTRIIHLVTNIKKVEYITTSNEADALLLESRLIKQHQPKYNVLLKDDKSFPYIKARFDHEFPQLIKYRGKITKDAEYFGPFANIGEVNKVLTFLHKTFKLRNCSDSYFAGRKRPCLQYQIGRCSAPCVGKISVEGYKESVNEALEFLKGNNVQLQKNLAKQMEKASAQEDYEKAAVIRDKIKSLSYIQTEGDNHIALLHDIDVVAAVEEAGIVCVSVSFYRGGHFYGHKLVYADSEEGASLRGGRHPRICKANSGISSYESDAKSSVAHEVLRSPNPLRESEDDATDAISSFLSTFYQSMPLPAEIIISHDIEDKDLITQALSQIHGTKTEITLPMKGLKKSLLTRAEASAREGLQQKVKNDGVNKQIYEEMAAAFHLPTSPERIEIYDNSHIMGTSAIGAFVVASQKGFQKKEYRYYNVENKIGDDYAMLREVLMRRLVKLKNGEGVRPDLLLIDGGKGQLSTAIDVMAKLNIDVPVVAIAKGPERNAGREVFYLPSGEEFTFDRNKPLMKYLQILRDEAHRFAIMTHRKKRARAMGVSSLDDIADIGPARKKALLGYFGSLEAIKAASVEEIAKVPGISKALAKEILSQLL